MKYLKLYESFDKGIEEWDSSWQTRNHIMRQTHGTDFFTKRELDFFRQFFVKTEQDDFFRVSGEKLTGKSPDGTPLSGERRSTFKARYMPGDNQINPIEISITRLKDDYFMVEISCLNKEESRFSEYTIGNTPRSKVYLVDTFEDLKYFLSNLRKYWKKINDSWKPIKESQLDNIDYYKQITTDEHQDWWPKITNMNQKDINLISGYFVDWKATKMSTSDHKAYIEFQIGQQKDKPQNINLKDYYLNKKVPLRKITIYKLEDEWWYVVNRVYKQSSNYGLYTSLEERFICDQFSGLEKLIFDELVDYSE